MFVATTPHPLLIAPTGRHVPIQHLIMGFFKNFIRDCPQLFNVSTPGTNLDSSIAIIVGRPYPDLLRVRSPVRRLSKKYAATVR